MNAKRGSSVASSLDHLFATKVIKITDISSPTRHFFIQTLPPPPPPPPPPAAGGGGGFFFAACPPLVEGSNGYVRPISLGFRDAAPAIEWTDARHLS